MMTDASSDISGAAWQRKYTLLGGRFTATLIGTTRRETLSVATLRSASMSSNTDSGELSTNLISGFFASSDIVLLLEVRGLAFDVSEGLRQRRHTVAEKAVAVVTGLAGAALDLVRDTCISASLWLGGLGPRNARSPGGPLPGLLLFRLRRRLRAHVASRQRPRC